MVRHWEVGSGRGGVSGAGWQAWRGVAWHASGGREADRLPAAAQPRPAPPHTPPHQGGAACRLDSVYRQFVVEQGTASRARQGKAGQCMERWAARGVA